MEAKRANSHEFIERRHVKLHKSGGSQSVVIPKEWLQRQGIEDVADLVLSADGITITRCADSPPSIEDEPEFAAFMNFLLADALSHPETLVDPTDLLANADELLDGVDAD